MTPARGPKPKTDDEKPKRVPVNLYLLPDVNKQLAEAALEAGVAKGEIVEQALAAWRGRGKRRGGK